MQPKQKVLLDHKPITKISLLVLTYSSNFPEILILEVIQRFFPGCLGVRNPVPHFSLDEHSAESAKFQKNGKNQNCRQHATSGAFENLEIPEKKGLSLILGRNLRIEEEKKYMFHSSWIILF